MKASRGRPENPTYLTCRQAQYISCLPSEVYTLQKQEFHWCCSGLLATPDKERLTLPDSLNFTSAGSVSLMICKQAHYPQDNPYTTEQLTASWKDMNMLEANTFLV